MPNHFQISRCHASPIAESLSVLALGLVALAAPVAVASATGPSYSDTHFTLELPSSSWSCKPAASAVLCQAHGSGARLTLTAEPRPNGDSLGGYLNDLRKPHVTTTDDGSTVTSQVKSAQRIVIKKHVWADAVHSEYERPKTLSRILVTIGPNLKFTIIATVPTSGGDDTWAHATKGSLDAALESVKTHESAKAGH